MKGVINCKTDSAINSKRRIQNPVKDLRQTVLRKFCTDFSF